MRSGSVRVKWLLFVTHFTHCSTLWQASQPRSFDIAEMHCIITYLSLWKVESYLLQNHISSSLPASPSAKNFFFFLTQILCYKYNVWISTWKNSMIIDPRMSSVNVICLPQCSVIHACYILLPKISCLARISLHVHLIQGSPQTPLKCR